MQNYIPFLINSISKNKPNLVLLATGNGQSELYLNLKARFLKRDDIQLLPVSIMLNGNADTSAVYQNDSDVEYLVRKVKNDRENFSVLIVCENDVDAPLTIRQRLIDRRITDIITTLICYHKYYLIRVSIVMDTSFMGVAIFRQSHHYVANEMGFYSDEDDAYQLALKYALCSIRQYDKMFAPKKQRKVRGEHSHHMVGSINQKNLVQENVSSERKNQN